MSKYGTERMLRYFDFISMKDSIKLRWFSLSSHEVGIVTCGSVETTSFTLHAGVCG